MTDRHHSQGFGIVELMVGVVIAILSSIAVLQVFALSERQKRTTTGAADAQSNGAVAMHLLERDIKMAGWGLTGSATANCANLYTYYDDGANPPGPVSNLLSAAVITDGGDQPDNVTLQYYANPDDPSFKLPSLTTLRSTMPQPSAELNVNTTRGCGIGDLAILMQGANCTLLQITQVQEQALKLQHNPGGTSSYNPPASYQNDHHWPAYSTGATLQCLALAGAFSRSYRVRNDGIELLQPDAAAVMQTYQVATGIVDLQAEYGVAPAGSLQVSEWLPATGAWQAPLSAADSRRIKALRIAIVARSAQYEKPAAGGACTTTTADMAANWSTWASFDTAAYPADWGCYRYKVFETIVPLRNVIWAGV